MGYFPSPISMKVAKRIWQFFVEIFYGFLIKQWTRVYFLDLDIHASLILSLGGVSLLAMLQLGYKAKSGVSQLHNQLSKDYCVIFELRLDVKDLHSLPLLLRSRQHKALPQNWPGRIDPSYTISAVRHFLSINWPGFANNIFSPA